MLDDSTISQASQVSGVSADDLSLLGDLSFSLDSGISVATTLVEGILSEFPISQDLLGSTTTPDAIFGQQVSKSDAYNPATVSDSDSDGTQRSDSDALSESVKVAHTSYEAAPRSEYTQERMKALQERRFTHPNKMKPSYTSGGRLVCALDWCALNPEGSVGKFNRYWADLSTEEQEAYRKSYEETQPRRVGLPPRRVTGPPEERLTKEDEAEFSHQIRVGLAEGTVIVVDTYDGEKYVQNHQ